MGQVKVILKSKVKNLGKPLDICDVKRGYAFNYLIPQGVAVFADEVEYRKTLKAREKLDKFKKNLENTGKEIIEKLANQEVVFEMKATPKGRLYGSISKQDLLDKLLSDFKIEILEDMIQMDNHLKSVGEHIVSIIITDDLKADLKVVVKKA